MTNENICNRRNEWNYPYKAHELLPHAQRKLDAYQTEEADFPARVGAPQAGPSHVRGA